VLTDGRPTIAMETDVRLMVLKARHDWGYRTLVAEVSDSIHLRRFCGIALSARVPDESTVRTLTRRIGDETVSEVTRALISRAVREKRFTARAVRIDSTVTEADIKYPTDAGLASAGVKALAREGRKLAARIKAPERRVRDRSRSMGRTLRAITRTIRRRTGQAKVQVMALTEQTGKLLEKSVREARRLAAAARASARGRGAQRKLREANQLDELAGRCEKVAGQIRKRVAGEAIADRIVSLSDPDARPIRKGKLGKPNENRRHAVRGEPPSAARRDRSRTVHVHTAARRRHRGCSIRHHQGRGERLQTCGVRTRRPLADCRRIGMGRGRRVAVAWTTPPRRGASGSGAGRATAPSWAPRARPARRSRSTRLSGSPFVHPVVGGSRFRGPLTGCPGRAPADRGADGSLGVSL
jgi:IS5 family transposase